MGTATVTPTHITTHGHQGIRLWTGGNRWEELRFVVSRLSWVQRRSFREQLLAAMFPYGVTVEETILGGMLLVGGTVAYALRGDARSLNEALPDLNRVLATLSEMVEVHLPHPPPEPGECLNPSAPPDHRVFRGSYRSHQGHVCEVVDLAVDEKTYDWLVLYRAGQGSLWAMLLDEFCGKALDAAGNKVWRFERVREGD
jgi:hypothetical protein